METTTSETQINNIEQNITSVLAEFLSDSSSGDKKTALIATIGDFSNQYAGINGKDPSGTVGSALTRLVAKGYLKDLPTNQVLTPEDRMGKIFFKKEDNDVEITVPISDRESLLWVFDAQKFNI